MKYANEFIFLTVVFIGMLWSCQKAPEFTFSGPSTIELKAEGGSSTISFTANRDWSISTSDPWVSVSPSSGSAADGTISVSVMGGPNATYEDRSATVTIRMEEFSQTVTVTQAARKGLIAPEKSYILSSDASSIEVEVQSNIDYSVYISVDWIKQVGTKGLVSSKLSFSIEENISTDGREGQITMKALDGSVPDQVINVTQAAKDAIIVKDTSFDMPYGGGAVEIKVEANVEFDVKPGSDWIHYVQTKAMSTSTICLSVYENQAYSSREGKVEIVQKGGALSHTVTIRQAGRVVVTGIELNTADLALKEGESATLVATLAPSEAIPREEINWSSSNTEVATVTDGKVTANKAGEATITASVDGFKATCSVHVNREYQPVSIADIRPVDILPVIGQVTQGDDRFYDHIEHLRLAEATRIRDMMWEYGAGPHSKKEYQKLMWRLNTGMTHEFPLGYDNYKILGTTDIFSDPSNHAHCEWFILNTLVKHANFIIPSFESEPYKSGEQILLEFVKANPNSINVFGQSTAPSASTKTDYDYWFIQDPNDTHMGALELYECKNYIHFEAGTNIKYEGGTLRNKIYNGEYEADENGYYSTCSMANSDKNTRPKSHLLVTIATDGTGDIRVDEEPVTGTKFPIGFADNVLFSGRAFAYHTSTLDEILASSGKPNTSFPNYVNVALMDICFQLYAEVKDADELLDMVRSTCLTDYVRFEDKVQPLQLINPSGYYKKYLTPKELPEIIKLSETISLKKGYYKGILFSIPGTEVKVNGEWIPFDAKNKDIILKLNPMNLEWRLNGDLLKKYGYTSGQTVEGQIVTVDDKWGGLRLEVPMRIQIR